MKYVIGIDLGTSATKTVLFDETGAKIASATAEYEMQQPQNGWAEQNPKDWIDAAVATISKVVADGGIEKADIVSLGISGQMHSMVLLDENDEVIRPAILWCDQRTAAECEQLNEMLGSRIVEITANPPLTGFTASKILWVKNHEPKNFKRIRHILLAKDYLRFVLTGDYATEVSDASGMQLLNVPKRRWSKTMIDALGIEESFLPKVFESPEITGFISESAAALTGLCISTAVVGGAGDNAAAAVGLGVVKAGMAFATIGTSGVVFAHTDEPVIDPKGRVHTFCCAVPGAWHVMGVTLAAGLSLSRFKDNFCADEISKARKTGENVYKLMDASAAKINPGCDGLLYLPYIMGERTPILDPNARGVFFGISAMHTRAHFIRAVMEGVSLSLMDCLCILNEMKIEPAQILACGGGGSSELWQQMLSDCFNLPVEAASGNEGAALGVAVLAAVGAGIYESVPEACAVMVKFGGRRSKPVDGNHEIYIKRYDAYKRLYEHLKTDFAAERI